MAVGGVSYLGSELYVSGLVGNVVDDSKKITYWESVSGVNSMTKEEIEMACVDGDGYSFWTTGKRSNDQISLKIHYIDTRAIEILDGFLNATGQDEICVLWFKPTDLVDDKTYDRSFKAKAIITGKKENTVDSSTAQGATYTFRIMGRTYAWDEAMQ